MSALLIGRDHLGTVSNAKFDGVTATGGTLAWALYDTAGAVLGSGAGSYTGTPGVFTYTIAASVFASMGPPPGTVSRTGRLHVVVLSPDGVSVSFGGPCLFGWPTDSAG